MHRHLYKHYLSVGHRGFLEHVSKPLIDKNYPSDPLKGKDCWRETF